MISLVFFKHNSKMTGDCPLDVVRTENFSAFSQQTGLSYEQINFQLSITDLWLLKSVALDASGASQNKLITRWFLHNYKVYNNTFFSKHQ